jgi:DnaJ-class molecular chaperone
LGVTFMATNAEITQAYRRAMKRAHPDRQAPERRAAAEEMARRLNAAYAVLSDPVKRQAYDRTIRQQVIQDQIMRQYVGGFQTPGGAPSYPEMERREQTPAERRERIEADRRAWLLLVGFAAVFAVTIIVVLVASALFGSLFQAIR